MNRHEVKEREADLNHKKPESTLSVKDVINVSGATERTVREWIRRKLFVSVKLGNRIWVDIESLKEFFEQRGIQWMGKNEDVSK